MKNYIYDLGPEHTQLKEVGTCSQLRRMATLMEVCRINGDHVWPRLTVGGHDIYERYFLRTQNRSKTHDGFLPNHDLWGTPEMEIEHSWKMPNHVQWSAAWDLRCSKIWETMGRPLIGYHVRETDKNDDRNTPIPTRIYLDALAEEAGPVFVSGDCEWTVGAMVETNRAVATKRHRSSNIFPIHRLHQLNANGNGQTDIRTHLDELFTDLWIFCHVEKIVYGTYSGIVSIARLMNPAVKWVDLYAEQDQRTRDILVYHTKREKMLWACIEDLKPKR